MAPAPDSPLLLLMLAGVALLAATGAILVRVSRGTRRGDRPHCRNCDYALVGIDSERCPECGAELRAPRAVVTGERVRRPRLAAAGVALALVGALLVVSASSPAVRRIDWYRVMPTGWLVDRVAHPSATGSASTRSWAELKRRMQSADLPVEQRQRLADMALAMQAAGTPGELLDWLGGAIADGKISDVQKARFFQQAVKLDLRVRPRVILGDPIPYEIGNLGRTSPGGQGWWHRIEYLAVTLDGKPSLAGGGSSRGWGFGAGGSSGSWIPCQTPGPHTVSAGARVRIYRGGSGFSDDNARSVLFHEREVTLTGSTVVVPAGAARDRVRSAKTPPWTRPFGSTSRQWTSNGGTAAKHSPARSRFLRPRPSTLRSKCSPGPRAVITRSARSLWRAGGRQRFSSVRRVGIPALPERSNWSCAAARRSPGGRSTCSKSGRARSSSPTSP